jgi:hypothetical protein
LRTCTSSFTNVCDDDAALDAAEPLPDEEPEHADIDSAVSAMAAPAALRENRRDIRMSAVPPPAEYY